MKVIQQAHYVKNMSFSSQAVYGYIESEIANLGIEDIITRRVQLKDDGIFSKKREHLAVTVLDASSYLINVFPAYDQWTIFSIREYPDSNMVFNGGTEKFLGIFKASNFVSSYQIDLITLHDTLAIKCIFRCIDELLVEQGERPFFSNTKDIKKEEQSNLV